MAQLNDRLARIIGIPVIGIGIPILMHFDSFLMMGDEFLKGAIISFINTILLWEGNRFIFSISRKRYPGYHQTYRRLLWQSSIALLYTLAVTLTLDVLCRLLPWGMDGEAKFLFFGFLVSLIPTIIVTLAYESVYFFEEWKENMRKTEQMARDNVQSQLDALKSQLDPHFLFNSLNTLAALIDDTNTEAQAYLDRLSDVYRYVLVSREKNTVSVDEEMAFLDAYVFLTKTRFRENLQVEKQISPQVLNKRIAPFSLQILVENALKHNVVSKEKTLRVRLAEEGGYLAVQNNLQEKTTVVKSTKVGLQNIVNRYKLLSSLPVEILKDEHMFKVRIPLLD